MRLALASGNPGKKRELAALLAPLGIEVAGAGELGFREAVEETGRSFAENARLKARAVVAALGIPALADDSGLCVAALGGAPGVLSARYAGPGGDDGANNVKLLSALAGVPPARRGAAFVCALALGLPDGRMLEAEGRWEGRIALAPAGRGGFGYDPLFELPGLGCTAAELPPGEKNAISHRGRALAALLARLPAFWRSDKSGRGAVWQRTCLGAGGRRFKSARPDQR